MDMPWFEFSLTRLERRLRELIEGDPAADGFSRKFHRQLESTLIAAMRAGAQHDSAADDRKSKRLIAPDRYTLMLQTQQAQQLLNQPKELDVLIQRLKTAAVQAGILFVSEPIIRVVAARDLSEVKVLADYCQRDIEYSHTTEVAGAFEQNKLNSNGIMPKAYLIVNGLNTYPITRAVTNIGRDVDNHIQLDDPRVSRMHAQLRFIQGRFVIFDLDSTGGTFVNDVAVSSHELNPGDVILLAGLPLVYGLEQVLPDGYTQEVPTGSPPTSPPFPPASLQ